MIFRSATLKSILQNILIFVSLQTFNIFTKLYKTLTSGNPLTVNGLILTTIKVKEIECLEKDRIYLSLISVLD